MASEGEEARVEGKIPVCSWCEEPMPNTYEGCGHVCDRESCMRNRGACPACRGTGGCAYGCGHCGSTGKRYEWLKGDLTTRSTPDEVLSLIGLFADAEEEIDRLICEIPDAPTTPSSEEAGRERVFQLYACPVCGEPVPRGNWRCRCKGCGANVAISDNEGHKEADYEALPERQRRRSYRLADVVDCVPVIPKGPCRCHDEEGNGDCRLADSGGIEDDEYCVREPTAPPQPTSSEARCPTCGSPAPGLGRPYASRWCSDPFHTPSPNPEGEEAEGPKPQRDAEGMPPGVNHPYSPPDPPTPVATEEPGDEREWTLEPSRTTTDGKRASGPSLSEPITVVPKARLQSQTTELERLREVERAARTLDWSEHPNHPIARALDALSHPPEETDAHTPEEE